MKSPQRKLPGQLANGSINAREAAVLEFAKQLICVEWDFSVDGNGTSPTFGVKLPSDCVVTDCWLDTITPVAGATFKPTLPTLSPAVDITAAQTLSSSAVTKPALSTAAGIKVSSTAELGATLSAAPTAGKVRVYVEYMKKP
jgi:hypothetical protein